MALTRKFLKSMGLEDEKVESIIEAHTETVDALKKERDDAITRAESITELEKERDSLREQIDKAGDAAKVKAEFDAYKAQVESDRLADQKAAAVRKALKEAGVQREGFEKLLLQGVDLDKVELDGDSVKDADALIAPLKESYAECFATTETKGVPPVNPPASGQQKLTREQVDAMSEAEIIKNWPAVQAAIGQK